MSSTNPPPGWHPDPANPTLNVRWWDGNQWTDDVRPAEGAQQPVPPYAQPGPGYGGGGGYGGAPYPGARGPYRRRGLWSNLPPAGPGASFSVRNAASIRAIIVALIYIALAVTTHFVLIGIIPLVMSVRAVQRREPMFPVAIVAAVVVLVVSVSALSGH